MGFTNPFINLIPPRIQFPLNYKGSWNASTNTPTLVSSVGTKGDFYIVSVAGSTNLNGVSTWNIGDWVVFNGSAWQKVDNSQNVVTVTAPLALNSGVLSIPVATTSANGYLSSTDWTTFNNKQAPGNYVTALTGDGTASGPGSASFTLSTVNSNVGTFGSSSSVSSFTVNAKGLITSASNTSIQIAESQVTNLVSDLSGKQASLTIGIVDTGGPNTSAINLIGSQLSLTSANTSFAGVVSTGTQSFAGDKTFTGNISASNLSGTNLGDFTTSAIDSSSPNGTGFQLTPGSPGTPANLALEAANGSFGGVLTAGTQTIGGNKTFTGTIAASNLSGTNTGNISTSAVGSSPNSTGMTLVGQDLNLEPASASFPGVVTTAAQSFAGEKTFTGNVILNNNNQLGIGTATPDASCAVDIVSTTRAFGIPTMTSTQKNNIGSPRLGSMLHESSTDTIWFYSIGVAWKPLIQGTVATNQIMYSGGTGMATGTSALTVSSGTVLNTLAGAAFRGTGSNSYIGIGANSSGTSGSIFAEANTATTYFSNTAAGDTVLRNSDTAKQIKIGVGSSASQVNVTNTLVYTNVNFAIGTGAAPSGVPLSFASASLNRKISFSAQNNDHQDESIGTTASSLRYQVRSSSFDHVFQSGINSSSSLELMRILGGGQVAIGTASPNASALLQVDSTTKGVLWARGTSAQRSAISSPAQFLEFNDTDLGYKFLYDTTAADWNPIFNRRIPQTKTVTSSVDFTTENWLINNAISTPVTITLPLLSAGKPGMIIRVIKTSANSANLVTMAAGGSDAINPTGAFTLATQYSSWKFTHMNTFWLVSTANAT